MKVSSVVGMAEGFPRHEERFILFYYKIKKTDREPLKL